MFWYVDNMTVAETKTRLWSKWDQWDVEEMTWCIFMYSSEYKQKYDEIVKQNGILTIDSRVSWSHLSCLQCSKNNSLAFIYNCGEKYWWHCLQYFDTVGWAAGRASGLLKNWVVGCWHGYLSGAKCRFAMALPMPLPFTISWSSKSRLVLPFW